MVYVKYKNANNAQSTLAADIATAGAGSCIVKTGEGALFPATGNFVCFIEHLVNDVVTKREAVIVTARTGDVFSITRSSDSVVQDDSADPKVLGTTAYTFVAGDRISMYFSYKDLQDLKDAVEIPASATVKGVVQEATLTEIRQKTETGGTGAKLFITPKKENVIEMTAQENLVAGNAVVAYYGSNVIKTIKRMSTAKKVSTTTGLQYHSTERHLRTIMLNYGIYVAIYKKSSDNKIYGIMINRQGVLPGSMETVVYGTEYVLSADVLETADGFDACQVTPFSYTTGFIVTYKKASDDKVYAVACSIDQNTGVITAGTPAKLYDTNILQSGTRPSICCLASNMFAVGIHDDVTDDPIVIQFTTTGNVVNVGASTAMEAVTMNASGRVLVCPLTSDSIAVFYDNGTNIRCNCFAYMFTTPTVKTPFSLGTGYITGYDKCMPLKSYQNVEAYEVMLFRGNVGYVTVNRVGVGFQGHSYASYNSANDYVIYMDTNSLVGFDVCPLGNTNKQGQTTRPVIGFVNNISSYSSLRVRTFNVGVSSLERLTDNSYSCHASDPKGLALTQLNSNGEFPEFCVSRIDSSSYELYDMRYVNNEKRFVGLVQEDALSGALVKIVIKGVAYYSTGSATAEAQYVGDSGTLQYSGTKQVGICVGTNEVLLT